MSRLESIRPKAVSVSIVHDDARAAAEEAAQELLERLGATPDIVFLFFSAALDPGQVVSSLRSALPPKTEIIGCSSYAEVAQEEALTGSVTALGLAIPGVERIAFARAPDGRSSYELGRSIGEEIRGLAPELVFLFPDVLQQNATQLLRGIQSVIGASVPVIGGASADAGTFTKTFQVKNGDLISGGVSGVALRGGVHVSTAARSGYAPVALPRVSNRVEGGNILLELDGQPALKVYRDFLGPRAHEMPAVSIEFPLGVLEDSAATEAYPPLVRAIFRVDEERQALVLGGDIPQGGKIRILRAAREDIIQGAASATEAARAGLPDADVAFLFNCMSRKVALGARYKEECEASFRSLPADLPRAGFYTFGELSPFAGVSVHHESTFTLALVHFGGHTP